MKTNFSNVRLPVSGERFVGRSRICCRILDYMQNNQSCDLMGLRRIGKTSVLREVERRLRECKSTDDMIGYVDLSEFSGKYSVSGELEDPESLLYKNLIEILDEELLEKEGLNKAGGQVSETVSHSKIFSSVYVAPDPSGRLDMFSFFKSFLKKFHKKSGGRFFVFLDEFDACCGYGERLAGFLKRIRLIIDSYQDTGFVCVLATSRSITMLESKTDGDASTLHNVLEHADIRPFSRESFEKLCDLSMASVPPEMRNKFFTFSFGHPFLATILLHHFNLLVEDGQVPSSFDDVFRGALSDFEDYFYEVRKIFASFPVGKDFTSHGIENWFHCLVWRELYHANIPNHVLETLRRYGFWTNDNENMPQVIHDYLARQRLDVWSDLRQIETRLRRLVEKGLRKIYGDREDWFSEMKVPANDDQEYPWKKEEKPFKEIVKGMRARRKKNQPGVPVSYLDCTYLDDLLNLMLIKWHWRTTECEWPGFSRYFDDDITKCREMILAAGAVRNPEAHFIDYPDVIKVRFEKARRYLTSILDKAENE